MPFRFALLVLTMLTAPAARAQLVWAQAPSSDLTDYVFSVAVDGDDTFVGGRVATGVDLDGDGAVDLAAPDGKAYVARYGPGGALGWVAGIDDEAPTLSSLDRAYVAPDGTGGVLVAGPSQGDIDFQDDGDRDVLGLGSRDGFVARYDAAGAFVWGRTVGSERNDDLFDATSDGDGGLYIAGRFRLGGDFDGDGQADLTAQGTQNNAAGNDAFLVRYDASGAIRWARSVSGPNNDVAQAVALGTQGRVTLTGRFTGRADFDGDGQDDAALASATASTAFVAQYASDGTLRWVYTVPVGGGSLFPDAIAGDGAGGAFVTGQFNGAVDFDGDGTPEITAPIGQHVFLLRLDASGGVAWATAATGPNISAGLGVDADGAGGAYVAGFFFEALDFDGDGTAETLSAGRQDLFVARYDAAGALGTVTPAGDTGADVAYGVAADGAGELLVVGSFQQDLDIDGDGATDLIASNSFSDAFVARLVGVPVSAEAPPASGLALAVAPNPSAGAATLRLTLDAPGAATVTLHDALGRTVATLHRGSLAAGTHAFALPGLAPGVYLARAATPGGVATRSFTVVR